MHSHIRLPLPHSLARSLHHSPTLLLYISPSFTSLRSSPPSLYLPPSLPSLLPTVPPSVSPTLLFTQSLSRYPLPLPSSSYILLSHSPSPLPLHLASPSVPLLLPTHANAHMHVPSLGVLRPSASITLPPYLSPFCPPSPNGRDKRRGGRKRGHGRDGERVRRTDGLSDGGDGVRQRRDSGRGWTEGGRAKGREVGYRAAREGACQCACAYMHVCVCAWVRGRGIALRVPIA